MDNKKVWNREYKDKRLMSGDKPQKSFLNFLKWVKKEERKSGKSFAFSALKVLDLGSGNGKNSIFLAKKGAKVSGIEFSKEAILLAKELEKENKNEIKVVAGRAEFYQKSIGEKFDFPENYFDIILDITSSNSLNEKERKIFLSESFRVLKKDGYFFSRGLLKDGDKNANFMLKNFPAKEAGTYTIPEFGLTEKVFMKSELEKMYKEFFKIKNFKKETHYTTYGERKYKRNFWLLYLKK